VRFGMLSALRVTHIRSERPLPPGCFSGNIAAIDRKLWTSCPHQAQI